MKQRYAFAVLGCVLSSIPAYSQCAGNDSKCWSNHNLERMQDQADRQMRETTEAAERARIEALRDAEAPRPSHPRPGCDSIDPLGSFSRGYQSGGLLGAFANLSEEEKNCATEAAQKRPVGVEPNQANSDFWTRVSNIADELKKQSSFDPELPRKTCEYHKSTIGKHNYDVAYVTACITVGLIK